MEFVPCPHCKTTDSCRNASGEQGCARCLAFWAERHKEFGALPDKKGVVCSVCWGKGIAEPANSKWQYRFPAGLALLILVAAGWLLYYFQAQRDQFEKILVFVSTLVGSVTGYYFGGERSRSGMEAPPKSAADVDTSHQQ